IYRCLKTIQVELDRLYAANQLILTREGEDFRGQDSIVLVRELHPHFGKALIHDNFILQLNIEIQIHLIGVGQASPSIVVNPS
ncbi:hypothetical protein, partial [Lysinibacillus sp. GbtcB16]|uniref:hypothetical protein n=1 Tax=Lysinibacillus sp. GbtcB16 TaxID=2824761 RepID=UPI001C30E197